ncbi:TIGR01459 family HAD-type hydrolase [Roseiterribacter gracilis]|uniref:Haloacid dehalogenase n=1 Tax=Roseiterribacter gracilis TaxID=2812848 RepID=A0A8S8X8M9_9PROT|nr:haloacid dehalogenase [Rhodospirillales bacterium TMPK1]
MIDKVRSVEGLAAIISDFDGVLLDQWGVLHDGVEAFPGALDALHGLRGLGKRIVLLSNSARRTDSNRVTLRGTGIADALYDDVVTSGEATFVALQERAVAPFDTLGRRAYPLGKPHTVQLVEGLPYDVEHDINRADFIVMGTADSPEKTVADYETLLRTAAERGLIAVCANPDRVAVQAGETLMAPGAIAARYEELGGKVAYIGKPFAPIYREALARLGVSDPSRVLAVGDSLEHDIAGGRAAGCATLWLRGGIHAAERDDAALYQRFAVQPDFVAERLAW